MGRLAGIWHLGLKELASLSRDAALVGLIVYAFTYAIWGPVKGAQMELRNASVAVVDLDRSMLSRRIADALLPPEFLPARAIDRAAIDAAMDSGRFTFVLEVPPRFQADVEAGRRPALQLYVDATAMSQAFRGTNYIAAIVAREVPRFLATPDAAPPVALVTRARFNPNLEEKRFLAIATIVNNITMLGIILVGAAVVREREHGTLEHLLVMPLTPVEIIGAKVWPNALVIVIAATLSLELVVRGALAITVQGSVPLFMAGALLYMGSVTSLSILLATLARSMPQFGLLVFLVFLVLNMLSGGTTPTDSMPPWLQNVMLFSPTTHFVSFSIAVLCRGATLADTWPHMAVIVGTGIAFFVAALARFRRTIAAVPA
ncbi:MAG: ABC transporter permease [Betaproteobacteria bacterium]